MQFSICLLATNYHMRFESVALAGSYWIGSGLDHATSAHPCSLAGSVRFVLGLNLGPGFGLPEPSLVLYLKGDASVDRHLQASIQQ